MKFEYEGIEFDWDEIKKKKEEKYNEGFDRHELVKRAKAFENTLFPIWANKLRRVKNYERAMSVFDEMRKKLKPFIKKVMYHEHAKAYYIILNAYKKFISEFEKYKNDKKKRNRLIR